ncbi:unnamed protein product [Miscanthus lutarioriparius]|uniref:WPP domain-containing protein n=1 Tax=Miscanthus lutarioriparius TaxID=422564 RepID=A0A811Q9X8_9POAL|nr:unnamed protein product [Miscanthus lutarioriparius]
MPNDDHSAAEDRWVRTVVEEIRRFQSLRPRPGRVLRYTPMPPAFMVAEKLEKLAGLQGYSAWPEASRIAAAAEAEGFAAASAYAAGKSLATDEERADVFKKYIKEVSGTAKRYAMSRPQAAGTSRSGPAAQPPPAASVAVVSGPVQQPGLPSASVPRSPSAPEE